MGADTDISPFHVTTRPDGRNMKAVSCGRTPAFASLVSPQRKAERDFKRGDSPRPLESSLDSIGFPVDFFVRSIPSSPFSRSRFLDPLAGLSKIVDQIRQLQLALNEVVIRKQEGLGV